MFSVFKYRFNLGAQTGALIFERTYVFSSSVQGHDFQRNLTELGAKFLSATMMTETDQGPAIPVNQDLRQLAVALIDQIVAENSSHVAWLAQWRASSGGSTFLKGFTS